MNVNEDVKFLLKFKINKNRGGRVWGGGLRVDVNEE